VTSRRLRGQVFLSAGQPDGHAYRLERRRVDAAGQI